MLKYLSHQSFAAYCSFDDFYEFDIYFLWICIKFVPCCNIGSGCGQVWNVFPKAFVSKWSATEMNNNGNGDWMILARWANTKWKLKGEMQDWTKKCASFLQTKPTFNVKESCVVRRLVVGWFRLVIHCNICYQHYFFLI